MIKPRVLNIPSDWFDNLVRTSTSLDLVIYSTT